MIDLGRECDTCPGSMVGMGQGKGKKGESKKSYPSVYIRGTEDLPDLPKGDFYILAKVSVSRLSIDTKDSESSSVELEIKEMKPLGEAEDESYSKEEEISSAADLAKKMGMSDEMDDSEED
jgi:hypothetical protein